jgi:O-acetyl-ADP-ribose deacetylase (regulator of RNase III)
MIKYIKKDITTVETGVVVHGCNCSGGFGSGVAGAIKDKWPVVEKAFRTVKNPTLGTCQMVFISDELFIFNGFTQKGFGYDDKVYASLAAIENVMLYVTNFAKKNKLKNVYMPKIGCGLGGLSWPKEVYPMLKELNTDGITLNVCIL